MYKWFALQFVGLQTMQNNENWENESPSVSPLSYFLFSSPGSRYASHAPYADATHAPWYRHAPGYEHDAWGAPSSWHPHEHGASRFAPSRPVTGWSAEDGSAESSHGAAAGGESQAAGEDNRATLLCDLLDAATYDNDTIFVVVAVAHELLTWTLGWWPCDGWTWSSGAAEKGEQMKRVPLTFISDLCVIHWIIKTFLCS